MGAINTIHGKNTAISIGGLAFESLDRVPFRVWARVFAGMIVTKLEKRRTRGHLSQLTPEQLRDIGVHQWQADNEVRKSYLFYERNR